MRSQQSIFSNFRKFQDELVSEPENSLELIFAHVLEKEKLREVRGDALKKFKLSDEQLEKISEMCDCRLSRMPVQVRRDEIS